VQALYNLVAIKHIFTSVQVYFYSTVMHSITNNTFLCAESCTPPTGGTVNNIILSYAINNQLVFLWKM